MIFLHHPSTILTPQHYALLLRPYCLPFVFYRLRSFMVGLIIPSFALIQPQSTTIPPSPLMHSLLSLHFRSSSSSFTSTLESVLVACKNLPFEMGRKARRFALKQTPLPTIDGYICNKKIQTRDEECPFTYIKRNHQPNRS